MKKTISLISYFLMSTLIFAQTKIIYQDTINPKIISPEFNIKSKLGKFQDNIPSIGPFDCSPKVSVNNNLILNPKMLGLVTPPNYSYNAFRLRYVDNWLNSHGTPSLNLYPSTIPGYNSAYMNADLTYGDGIGGKIEPLVNGRSYQLFFNWASHFGTNNPDYNNRDFNIYLTKCSSSVPIFPTGSSSYPPVLSNTQQIFCDKDFFIGPKQQSICFTANSNYDMIWIFPKKSSTPHVLSVGFYAPVLVDVTKFGITVNNTLNPCIKVLSANVDIPNANYTWLLNGILFSTSQNPQINVSTQNGIISLTVNRASSSTTNTCSNNSCNLTASTTVSGTCSAPINNEIWTWMNGNNTVNEPGIYGTLGTPDAANKPGARFSSMGWTDFSGNLWLFGGAGYASSTSGSLNDLWKYNISSGQFTWMKGSNLTDQYSTYGNLGIPDPANTPGSRTSAQTWTDGSGNLWLFGGWGKNPQVLYDACHSDLWKFEVTGPNQNQWTWVKGSSTPDAGRVFGTQGIASIFNSPGCKGMAPTWTDNNGNFWMYSGYNSIGSEDDLWRFDMSGPNQNQWTWVKGSHVTSPVYGIKGLAASNNTPGMRHQAVTWTDSFDNLWLFGGRNENFEVCNDLWKFSISLNSWTWVSGDNITGQSGIYGTKGIASPVNKPGARFEAVSWIDISNDNLFLFGGQGYATNQTTGSLNDLWKYNITSDRWTWVSGDNYLEAISIYGTLGVGSVTTKPGARSYSVSWRDPLTGTLWLFGGIDGTGGAYRRNNWINDLWKYNNPTSGQCCQLRTTNESSFSNNISESWSTMPLSNKFVQEKDVVSIKKVSVLHLYNSSGQLVKIITNTADIDQVLQKNRVSGISSGLFFLRIFYTNKTVKIVKKFFN